MGPLLAGIVLVVLALLLPVPYVLWVIMLVIGAVLIVWGLYLLVTYAGPRGPRYSLGRWR